MNGLFLCQKVDLCQSEKSSFGSQVAAESQVTALSL